MGLWADPNPAAPWDFRHARGTSSPPTYTPAAAPQQTYQHPTYQPPVYQQPATGGTRTVYYAPYSGKRYHSSPGCRGLARPRSVSSSTLQEAQAMGLKPCGICGG